MKRFFVLRVLVESYSRFTAGSLSLSLSLSFSLARGYAPVVHEPVERSIHFERGFRFSLIVVFNTQGGCQ